MPQRFHLAAPLPADGSPLQDGDLRLGSQSEVQARIAELLPGTTFDAGGRGVFRRSAYTVTLEVEGPEPSCVVVEIDTPEGLVVVERLAAKTGWDVIEPSTGRPLSVQKGQVIPLPPRVAPPRTPVCEAAEPRGAGRLLRLAASLLVLGACVAGAFWWSRERAARPLIPSPTPGVAGQAGGIALTPEMVALLKQALSGGGALPPEIAGLAKQTTAASGDGALPPEVAALLKQATASGGGAEAPPNIEALRQAFQQDTERLVARVSRMKHLAPEFRGNPVVHQLLDFRQAAAVFQAELAADGVPLPATLADPAVWSFRGRPYLPPQFASHQRDGYVFAIDGRCEPASGHLELAGTLCRPFTYSARPLDPSRNLPAFALISDDFRVHYRADGSMPGLSDPTVDNLSPSSAAGLPGGTPETASSESEPGVLGGLLQAASRMMDGAFGPGGAKQAATELHENNALRDLREFATASQVFLATLGEGQYYATPEQLSDAALFVSFGQPPPLGARFTQEFRQGYRFEFLGERMALPRGALAKFARLYRSFVYVARPVEPGPAGRRALALYPDGQVYARLGNEVPTPADTPLGTR